MSERTTVKEVMKTTPLTREEMATYMDYLNTNTENTAKSIKSYCDNQTNMFVDAISNLKDTYNTKITQLCDKISLLVEAQTDSTKHIESLRKSLFAISKDIACAYATVANATNTADGVKKPDNKVKKEINPKFVSSLSNADALKWGNDVWKSCGIIGKRCGKTNSQVLEDIYNALRKIGEDIDGMFKEYCEYMGRKESIGAMISRSDYYRPLVEKYIKELHVKYYPEKYAFKDIVHTCPSKEAIECPQVVKDIITGYAKKRNISEQAACSILYRKLKKASNIDFNAEKKAFENRIGFKNSSPGYFVSKMPNLLSIMKSVAEE